MALTTKGASHIIVLGVVISLLPISSTLLQNGNHGHVKRNRKQRRRRANQTSWISANQMCQMSWLSPGIPDTLSKSNSATISKTISKTLSETVSVHIKDISETISESNSDYSLCNWLLQESGLPHWLCEVVSEHLSSWYVAQVDISVSSHICSKLVLGCNVCNCSSAVDSILDTCDQWLWIREHVRDSQDAELIQQIWDLCESPAAYSKRRSIRHESWTGQSTSVFSISCQPLLQRWWPVHLVIYSDPGIEHSPNWHNIYVRHLLLLRNADASPLCRWGTATWVSVLQYAHCSGHVCTVWELRRHMRYRAE